MLQMWRMHQNKQKSLTIQTLKWLKLIVSFTIFSLRVMENASIIQLIYTDVNHTFLATCYILHFSRRFLLKNNQKLHCTHTTFRANSTNEAKLIFFSFHYVNDVDWYISVKNKSAVIRRHRFLNISNNFVSTNKISSSLRNGSISEILKILLFTNAFFEIIKKCQNEKYFDTFTPNNSQK